MFQHRMKGATATTNETAESIETQSPPQATRWQRLSFRNKLIFILLPAIMLVGLVLGLGLGLGLHHASATPVTATSSAAIPSPSASADTFAKPTVGSTWDYPLGYNLTTLKANSSTTFYSVDLVNTGDLTIPALKKAGHFIACYFSAGSVESYRDDAGDFPSAAVGNVMDGWDQEKWVDTRSQGVRDVMQKRIQLAAEKGCDGIDPDNIDGYAEDNDTGFDLTEEDGVDYIKYLAGKAHALGLSIGLKNGGDIVDRAVDFVEWEINEQCAQFDECDSLTPFIDAGKPVFHVEYTTKDNDNAPTEAFMEKACAAGGQKGFSTIVKHQPLDEWIKFC